MDRDTRHIFRRSLRALLLAGALLWAAAPAAFAGVAFGPPVAYDLSGSEPRGIAVGDLDGDGIRDFAVTSQTADSTTDGVTVLIGDGAGGFADNKSFRAPYAWGIDAADLNGDGNVDLAVTQGITDKYGSDAECGAISGTMVFLGRGDGTFAFKTCVTGAGRFPIAVAARDFDRDGKRDLAVANNMGAGGIEFHRGNGDGTFGPAVAVPGASGANGTDLASSDLDGDGDLDLVFTNYDGGNVYLGNGDGTFARGSGVYGGRIAVTDLDGDGDRDIATVEQSYSGSLRLGRNNGDGTFTSWSSQRTDTLRPAIAVGDVDRDGRQDVAVSSENLRNVRIYLGNGDGTAQTPLAFGVGAQPELLAVEDLNRDGWPDLAVPDRNYGDTPFVSVLAQVPGTPPPPSDTTPPAVAVTSPAAGSRVANRVDVTASASDDVGVTQVRFYVDGTLIGQSAGPGFTVSWDTTTATRGSHTLWAVASDAAGNSTESTRVAVQVDNLAPWITSTPPSTTVRLGSTFRYQVTSTGAAPIVYSLPKAPTGMTIDTRTGAITWTPMVIQLGTHAVSVRAQNAWGEHVQSFSLTVGL